MWEMQRKDKKNVRNNKHEEHKIEIYKKSLFLKKSQEAAEQKQEPKKKEKKNPPIF